MRVFLTGFMGSGKSTAGKYAARQLNMSFVDLDTFIEQDTGKTIPELFREFGEEQFRGIEQLALQKVCALYDHAVISTGGGTPCFFDNMEYMNRMGITVFLDLSSARVTDRLRKSDQERPLLEQAHGDLQTWIHKKLLERAPFYMKAQYTLSENKANKKDLLELLKDIVK